LDTETTGLEPREGHRIIELGCVEILNRRITRRHYHQYVNPKRDIDEGALEVHGISRRFLEDKPVFAEVWDEFLGFIKGAELIIHNAAFDVAFIDAEMHKMNPGAGSITQYCDVVDSLALARSKHPGQKNSLDALCKRYSVDNSQRELHGALLDAEILADVYLLLTGGQGSLGLGEEVSKSDGMTEAERLLSDDLTLSNRAPLKVVHANIDELSAHDETLNKLSDKSDSGCLWLDLESTVS